jgi:mannose/fructose/N-acetylgalactosamine-specific phosphotransferase system component IIC
VVGRGKSKMVVKIYMFVISAILIIQNFTQNKKKMENKNIIYIVLGIAIIGTIGAITYFWLNQPSNKSENKTKQDRVITIKRA